MNNKKLGATQKMSLVTQIPFDMLTKMPYIKMCSNRDITIEDAGKLLHYDSQLVKVKQGKNSVVITGSDLKIKCLANNDLRVEGCIYSISFEM